MPDTENNNDINHSDLPEEWKDELDGTSPGIRTHVSHSDNNSGLGGFGPEIIE